ncbi:MAG: hypothetical protein ACI9HK_000234 [Pirellulaceae bacterium]|jgi:hypothetical protein
MSRLSQRRLCGSPTHAIGRRAFLGAGAGVLAGGAAGLGVLGSPAFADQLKKTEKRVILLFLSGGASQFETWDPKPGRPTGGPFMTIPTTVPGVHISELMPLMAQRIHKHTAIIRSISTANTGHDGRGVRDLLSGERKDTGNLDVPSLGSMLAKELSNPGSSLPEHIAFYSAYVGLTLNNQSDFAGFLGGRYEPINILSRLSPEAIKIPPSLTSSEDQQRHALRKLLSQQFRAERQRDVTLASYDAAFGQVRNLSANDKLFDISNEPAAIRKSYGNSLFAQQAIVARRLVEAGVPFVRLNRGWWDSHGENFDIHAALVPDLDKVMSALLDDLEDRGMLDHTLVVTFAEMGRTPTINNMRGRDHWGKCWSAALSGCGIKRGVVYGSTNADGTDVAENPVSAAEFFATVFNALGIDHQKQYIAPDGRPVTLTPYETEPIKELLA